jgi:arabinogalactan endo-1,4-beta-galactosidase
MNMKLKLLFMYLFLGCIAGTGFCAEFMIGADISALGYHEEAGTLYRDKDGPDDLIAILKDNGFNTARLRIFVNPQKKGTVVNDLPYTLNLAKRAKDCGMEVLLNFHYSDTWADPQKQIKPKAWAEMSFEELRKTVESYTASVMKAFKDADVLPEMVQIGNEITPGMLWPDGKVTGEYGNDGQWEKFATLIKAGIAGVRQADPEGDVKIMIHIDKGASKKVCQWFFTRLNKNQVPYDIIGISYYPWWHGTMEGLEENLNYIATELKKDVVVVETAYHHADNELYERVQEPPFPQTPQGQRDFLYALTKMVLKAPDDRGRGVCYWYPESVAVNRRIWMKGNVALFDSNGKTLPSVRAFADAVGSEEKK